MNTRKKTFIPTLVLFAAMALSAACSAIPALTSGSLSTGAQAAVTSTLAPQPTPTVAAVAAVPSSPAAQGDSSLLAAYEGTLQEIYTRVSPSVVAIRVVSQAAALDPFQQFPGFGGNGNGNGAGPQLQQALGSGFVWDTSGHIVTNNHVVEGAQKIEVTFSDGTVVPATLVGADPDSDLAVVKVELPAGQLVPVTVGDSTSVKVGQLAIALGNPFGLENTMTVGIVSALGRTLPAGETTSGGTYSIPNIIQTDAPINPGNSGGVLLDVNGNLIGVPSAIDSSSGSNSGVGFVIPSQIVSKVVPVLIKDGKYEHSWLGISGASLTPDMAKAMNLDANQHGVLVATVTTGSPADKAGLKPSDREVTIDGQQIPVGGDVITAIDGQATNKIEDLISYLATNTSVGQNVTLTVLRDGKEVTLNVTLAARPSSSSKQVSSTTSQAGEAYLGIKGVDLDAAINKAIGLPADTQGVLIVQVEATSPAGKAGLKGGSKPALVEGQILLTGGDVLMGLDGNAITSSSELRATLAQYHPGDQVTLDILRDGSPLSVTVTLEARPN